MRNVKPFVKWVGGKTQLLSVIHEMMPKDYNRYYEPFVGGGALFFDLQPEDAVINDINPSLINTYRQLRADAALVNHHLRLLDEAIAHEGEAYFYDVRTLFNEKMKKREMDSQLAAIFIFLSKHSFNGLFRQNSKGEYNSPSNHETGPSTPEEILLADGEVLRGKTVLCGDFEQAVRDADRNDFVFIDSPYAPLKATSFDKYTATGFAKEEHERLACVFRDLNSRGCQCMLTNHNTEFIRSLYDGFNMREVSVRRSINSDGAHRHGKEIIITNY